LASGHPNFHQFISQEPSTGAAAIGILAYRIRVHFGKMVARGLDDFSRRFKITCGSGYITWVMISDLQGIIRRLVYLERPFGNEIPSQVANMDRVGNFQKIHRPAQGGGEGQTGPPGVSSLSPINLLHL
jgi:hypothetical protein